MIKLTTNPSHPDQRPLAPVPRCTPITDHCLSTSDREAGLKKIDKATQTADESSTQAVLMRREVHYIGSNEQNTGIQSIVVAGPHSAGIPGHTLLLPQDLVVELQNRVEGKESKPLHYYENFRKGTFPMRLPADLDVPRLFDEHGELCLRNTALLARDELERRTIHALRAYVQTLTVSGDESVKIGLQRVCTSESPKVMDDDILKMSVHATIYLHVLNSGELLLFRDVTDCNAFVRDFERFCYTHDQYGTEGPMSMFMCKKPTKTDDRKHCLCVANEIQTKKESIVFLFDMIYNNNRAFRLFGCSKINDEARTLRDARRYDLQDATIVGEQLPSYSTYDNHLIALAETMATQPMSHIVDNVSVLALSVEMPTASKKRKQASKQSMKRAKHTNTGNLQLDDNVMIELSVHSATSTLVNCESQIDLILTVLDPHRSLLVQPRTACTWYELAEKFVGVEEQKEELPSLQLDLRTTAAAFSVLLDACNNTNAFMAVYSRLIPLFEACTEAEQQRAVEEYSLLPSEAVQDFKEIIRERSEEHAKKQQNTAPADVREEHKLLRKQISALIRQRIPASAENVRDISHVEVRYDQVSKDHIKHFPMCMKKVDSDLRNGKHVKDNSRMAMSGFLYTCGFSEKAAMDYTAAYKPLQEKVRWAYNAGMQSPTCENLSRGEKFSNVCVMKGKTVKDRVQSCMKTAGKLTGDSQTGIEDLAKQWKEQNKPQWSTERYFTHTRRRCDTGPVTRSDI